MEKEPCPLREGKEESAADVAEVSNGRGREDVLLYLIVVRILLQKGCWLIWIVDEATYAFKKILHGMELSFQNESSVF